MSKLTLNDKLSNVQSKLIAPKGQYNSFGKYKYRNCEDILLAVKPLLKEYSLTLVISDEVTLVGDRFYICATATISDSIETISNKAFAREPMTKKGMDEAQITGATSSYARKYALNGLLCIDDNQDPDTQPPVKVDYKKVASLVDEIKNYSAKVTQNKTNDEKMAFMQDVLKVSSFNMLSRKSESDLEKIVENLKDMIE